MKNNKKLLDEVFLIFRIIKVEARFMSRSQRLRLMTLTETLIVLDITETEANDGFFFLERKYMFLLLLGKQHKVRVLDMITLTNHDHPLWSQMT